MEVEFELLTLAAPPGLDLKRNYPSFGVASILRFVISMLLSRNFLLLVDRERRASFRYAGQLR